MQLPPQQYPQHQQPPQKQPNFLLIVLAVIVAVGCVGAVVVAAILFPVFNQAKSAAKKTMALSNIKRSALGMIMYSVDYDDRLPPANQWMDVATPYVKDESVYVSPLAREKDPTAYGFAFRQALDKKNTAKLDEVWNWAMIFDSTLLHRNASSNLETLPNPGRYGSGDTATDMIAFADGHAKAYKPRDVLAVGSNGKPMIR